MGKRGRPRRAIKFCAFDARTFYGQGRYCSARCRSLARGLSNDPRLDATPKEIQQAFDLMVASGDLAAEALRRIAGDIARQDLARGSELAIAAARFHSSLAAVVAKKSLRLALAGEVATVFDKSLVDKLGHTTEHGGMQAVRKTKDVSRLATLDVPGIESRVGKKLYVTFYLIPELRESEELGFGPEGVPTGTFQEWVRRCVRAGNKNKTLIAEMRKWIAERQPRVEKRRERERRKKP